MSGILHLLHEMPEFVHEMQDSPENFVVNYIQVKSKRFPKQKAIK